MASTTTYTLLLADIQRETEDDSPEMLAEFPRMLARVQDRLQRDLNLRHFHVYTSTTLTSGTNVFTFPSSSWLRVDGIFVNADGTPLEQKSYAFLRMFGPGTGRPRYYCRDTETTLYIAPKPDASYAVTIDTLSRLAALAETTNETNWLTANCADIYLLAALAEAERFLKSLSRAAAYEEQYKMRLAETKAELGHIEAVPNYAATAGDLVTAKEG